MGAPAPGGRPDRAARGRALVGEVRPGGVAGRCGTHSLRLWLVALGSCLRGNERRLGWVLEYPVIPLGACRQALWTPAFAGVSGEFGRFGEKQSLPAASHPPARDRASAEQSQAKWEPVRRPALRLKRPGALPEPVRVSALGVREPNQSLRRFPARRAGARRRAVPGRGSRTRPPRPPAGTTDNRPSTSGRSGRTPGRPRRFRRAAR